MIIGLVKALVFKPSAYCENDEKRYENSIFEVKSLVDMPHVYAEEIGCEYINIVKRKIGDKLYNVIFDDIGFFDDGLMVSLFHQHNPGKNIFGSVIITGPEDECGELTSLSEEDVKIIVEKIVWTAWMIQGKEVVAPAIMSGD